jgi:hypothetical protein
MRGAAEAIVPSHQPQPPGNKALCSTGTLPVQHSELRFRFQNRPVVHWRAISAVKTTHPGLALPLLALPYIPHHSVLQLSAIQLHIGQINFAKAGQSQIRS